MLRRWVWLAVCESHSRASFATAGEGLLGHDAATRGERSRGDHLLLLMMMMVRRVLDGFSGAERALLLGQGPIRRRATRRYSLLVRVGVLRMVKLTLLVRSPRCLVSIMQ